MATIDLTKDSDDEQAPAPQRSRDDDEAASLALARQLQAEEEAAARAPPPQPRRVDERPAKRPRSGPQIERVHAAGGVLDPSILSRVDAIVQQSNCVGCDGRGLAAAIAEKLPYGDTYKDRRPMPPARKFAIPEDRAAPGSIAVRRGDGPAVVSLFAQFEMGAAMKYRRVRPEPAGGDTKANRLRWFKEGLTKLASEDFRRVAFPPVWKSNSDLGYTESYCGDLLQPKRHRADAGMEATSRRWRGIYAIEQMQLRGRRRRRGLGAPEI